MKVKMWENSRTMFDKKTLKESIIYTFVVGFIAHGYCFLNLLVSHDSLNDFYVYDRWERANFGRIFYTIYISLTRGRIVLPWLIGILTLCWISVAVYLITKMLEMLERITDGNGEKEDIEKLEKLANTIKNASVCGLGQTAPNPVLSTLKYFRDEYVAHIEEKKCPAGECKALANNKKTRKENKK